MFSDPSRLEEAQGPPLTRADVERLLAEAGSARRLDLRGVNLTGADLSYLDLAGADLARATLKSVRLCRANLAGANLAGANFGNEDPFPGPFRMAATEPADLSYACLQAANLEGANVRYAVLAYADLRQANLKAFQAYHASFEHALMQQASLEGGEFNHARFRAAALQGADCSGGWFHSANFRDAMLDGAQLSRALFCYSDLSRTSLRRAQCGWTDFSGARLTDASLVGANLQHASLLQTRLDFADCTGADFSNAYLLWTDLRQTRLVRSSLTRADLLAADLRDAVLTASDLRGANLRRVRWQGATLEQARFGEPSSEPGSKAPVINEIQGCNEGSTLLFRWQIFPYDGGMLLDQEVWQELKDLMRLCWLALNGRFAELGREASLTAEEFCAYHQVEETTEDLYQKDEGPFVVEVRVPIDYPRYLAVPIEALEEWISSAPDSSSESWWQRAQDVRERERNFISGIIDQGSSAKRDLLVQRLLPVCLRLEEQYNLRFVVHTDYLTVAEFEILSEMTKQR